MYARHLSFKSTPEKRAEVEALADRAYELMKSMSGFVTAHFLISDDETTYGSFSLWESKDDADAASSQFREKTMPVVEKLATGAPTVSTYEVYKLKT